jgi:hypothetical protein
MKPGTSTSQVDVAVRWVIDASPAAAMATPSALVIDGTTFCTDSDLCNTLTRKPNGATDIDVVVVRDGKNFKGRMLGIVLGLFGKRVLGKAFANTVKAIEARNDGTRKAEHP